jgi:hypothetical protein
MKKLAYGANIFLVIAWLLFLIGMMTEKGVPGVFVFGFFLLISIPIINFLALAGSGKGKDYFSLYFEQKNLERLKK